MVCPVVFLFIKYCFCGGLGFRKHLQNVWCGLHCGCGGSAGLSPGSEGEMLIKAAVLSSDLT